MRLSCQTTATSPLWASMSEKNWCPAGAASTARGRLQRVPLFVVRITYTSDCPTAPGPAEVKDVLLGLVLPGRMALYVR